MVQALLAFARADNLEGIVSLDLCWNRSGPQARGRLRERFGGRVELKRPWEE